MPAKMPGELPLLAFDRVTCARGGRILFADLSFALNPGDALQVCGPNGVGKSSLLRVAAGLLSPLSGLVRRPVAVAFSDEHPALDSDRRGAEALAVWAGLDATWHRVSEALEALDIAHLAPVPVRLLSTGQRQRTALARLIATGAPLWLLDEPANGLDASAIEALARVIAAHRSAGGALVYASHLDLGIVPTHCIELCRFELGAEP